MVVGIAVALYKPNLEFLRKQMSSLVGQVEVDVHFGISIDHGSPSPNFSEVVPTEMASKMTVVENRRQQAGLVYNFENALRALPPGLDYYGFCDQDDFWHANKLAKEVSALPTGSSELLVHSDLSIVDANDRMLFPSCWRFEKRNFSNPKSVLELVLRNRVTGCTLLFKKTLLQYALPFPSGLKGEYLHDHWCACIAQVFGGIVDLDTPLVDYRQHGGNVVGASQASSKTYLLKKMRNLFSIVRKSKAALRSRQRLARDLIERVGQHDLVRAAKLQEELAPILNLKWAYCLKRLLATKGQWPEAGLWIQLSIASITGGNS